MPKRVVIVGGGLAGLSCAVKVLEGGAEPVILERSDAVGGRVCSREIDGFTIDGGFQVFLDAYPTAGQLLDTDALELGKFRPGALLFDGGKLKRVMDPFRAPLDLPATLLSGVGNVKDKLLVGKPLSTSAAGSGYIAPADLVTEVVDPLMAKYPGQFGGVMGWQYLFDQDGTWGNTIGTALKGG